MDSLLRTDVLGGGNPLETHFGDRVKIVQLSGNVFENLGEEKASSVYMRGQVWYWEDPIYGRKEEGRKIQANEGTMRYNRYVIILQDNLEQHDSLMVVPLSSTSNSSYDVEIEVLHVLCDSTKVYARPRLTFPATKNSLKRYVCTLSNKDMNMISYRIAQLSMPAGITKFMGDQLKSFYKGEINIDLYDDELYKTTVENTTSSELASQEMQCNQVGSSTVSVDSKDNSDSKKGSSVNKWTKNIKKNFVKLYDEKGADYVAKKYGISKSTVYTYIYKFRDEIGEPIKKEEEKKDEKSYKQGSKLEHIDEIPQNCKEFGLFVKRYFMSRNAYITYRTSGKKHKASKESPKFYEGIASAVSASLMKLCYIENINGTLKFTIDIHKDTYKASKCVNALIFLNDFNEFSIKDGKQITDAAELMKNYRNVYAKDFGIDPEWENELYSALCKRLGSVNYNCKSIKDFIIGTFGLGGNI